MSAQAEAAILAQEERLQFQQDAVRIPALSSSLFCSGEIAACSRVIVAQLGRADKQMEAGTRMYVRGEGHGTYAGFKKRMIGANEHTIKFDS
eukprot:COSAG04_NODE_10987_length_739_cov_0.962500_1_plen_91_part_10